MNDLANAAGGSPKGPAPGKPRRRVSIMTGVVISGGVMLLSGTGLGAAVWALLRQNCQVALMLVCGGYLAAFLASLVVVLAPMGGLNNE